MKLMILLRNFDFKLNNIESIVMGIKEFTAKMDKLWDSFWTGGITNPLTVIEQISYLMFARLADIAEQRRANRSRYTDKNYQSSFPSDEYRWKSLIEVNPQKGFETFRDKIFPFYKKEIFSQTAMGPFLKDAQFQIPSARLFHTAIMEINDMPLEGDRKGDLYEHLLSKLSTAGINGQFRTPRHVIRAMVELIDPKPNEIVCDPACGTGGFLVAVMEYLLEKYTSPELATLDDDGNKHFPGDLLADYHEHVQNRLLNGFDFDLTMLRLSCMNLLLHGIDKPNIFYQDMLSAGFNDHFPQQSHDYFDVIMANPPFKGSLDHEVVNPELQRTVKTKQTELLFLHLMVRLLKIGGRCAVIVPDGVLFGSSRAHVGTREMLVEQNQLEAVISLPSGVFKPYAGVSTAILIFAKGGNTGKVWFYKVDNDGFSLDDRRQKINSDDLPDLVANWKSYDHGQNPQEFNNRTAKAFLVPAGEIRENNYDLSINRYKEVVHKAVKYDPPAVILDNMVNLEQSILTDLANLKEMLK